MAKKSINKEIFNNQFKGVKRPVYSIDNHGLLDDLIVEDYEVSDKLSNLNFEYGLNLDNYVDGAAVPAVPETVTLIHGQSNAYLKTIAAGFTAVEKNTTGVSDVVRVEKWNAASNVTVNAVDAGNIYGGIVVTTDCNCKTINFSTSTNRYENIEAIVEGPRTVTVNSVSAKGVYGGGAGYGSVLQGEVLNADGKLGSVLRGEITADEKKYGKAVDIKLTGDNKITNVFGGGQKGAVVNGDVYIDVSRTDAKSRKIGTIYGGGEQGVVNGDVYITVHGINAINVGTISGSGKGKNAEVNGDRYLIIDGYSGEFKTTIKDFDRITFQGGTTVTLKQSQQKSIMSAQYEFVIDEATEQRLGIGETGAMLTWNKNINVGKFFITVTDDFATSRDKEFSTTIFSSSYLTQQAFDTAGGVRVLDENGNLIKGYTTEFVADVNEKTGEAKKKGGTIVLKFEGTNGDVTADDTKKREFSPADDDVNIRGEYVAASVDLGEGNNKATVQKGTVMAGNITAGSGDDEVMFQTNTLMAGETALGEGNNKITVLGGAEVSGPIKFADGTEDKHVTNTLDINGTISQIEGGNEFTDNVITIKNPQAVGYWKYQTGPSITREGEYTGDKEALDASEIAKLAGETKWSLDLGDWFKADPANFVPQDLDLTRNSGTNDKVVVTKAANWAGNINFGAGKDMLVLHGDANGQDGHGTITKDGGDLVVVADQTGTRIDATKMNLAGTDTFLVLSNGVQANVEGIAIGDYELAENTYDGIFLGQNAILTVNDEALAVQGFKGNLNINKDLLVLTAPDLESEKYDVTLRERISPYYTAGKDVTGNIRTNGNDVTLYADTAVIGDIISNGGVDGQNNAINSTITLLKDAKIDGTVVGKAEVYFKQDAGNEELTFENDGEANAATIRVAKNVIATVGSINGIAGTTFRGEDNFEKDSAQVALNNDAALYAAQDKNLIVGNITKDTDFTAFYKDEKGYDFEQISVIDEVKGRVTFTDAKVYLGNKAAFRKGITFKGANTVDIVNDSLNADVAKRQKIVIDTKQLFIKDAESVTFNVKDGSELVFDGIVKGEELDSKIQINLEKNARLAYGDTMEIKDWNKGFRANELDARTNLNVREEALVDSVINLDAANDDLTVNIADKAFVKGELMVEDKAIIRLGQGNDTLNVAAARVDGIIDASNDADNEDVINLAGSKVNGVKVVDDLGKFGNPGELTDEKAITLDGADKVFMTDKATVNGDITGGALVHIENSEVTGSIEAAKNVLIGEATVDTIKGGDTFVEGKDTEATVKTIDVTKKDVALYADLATAKITEVKGAADGKNLTLEARNGGKIAFDSGLTATLNKATITAVHDDSVVEFNGDVRVAANEVTLQAVNGGAFEKLEDVVVVGHPGANQKAADLKTLTGTLYAADKATLESVNGKAINAGDVTFVAKQSTINLDSEGTFNTLGEIKQRGTVTADGYGRVTDIALANDGDALTADAEIKIGEKTNLSAKSVDQYANYAKVEVKGTMSVEGDLAQTAANKAEVTLGGKDADGADIYGTLNVGGFIVQESKEGADAAGNDYTPTTATIEGKGDLTAAAIQQVADAATAASAKIAIEGSTTITEGNITQESKGTANITLTGATSIAGSIDQTAGDDAADGTKAAVITLDSLDEKAAVASIAQTATATGSIELNVTGDVTAASVTQNSGLDENGVAKKAKAATVKIDGTFTGAVDQTATTAAVEFANVSFDEENNPVSAVSGVGDVDQVGDTSAQVLANVGVSQKYENEKFYEKLDKKTIPALERNVGSITQESKANTVTLGAKLEANGQYDKDTVQNTDYPYHKAAQIDIGDLKLTAKDIVQKGVDATNKVEATLDYKALGESDVTIGTTDFTIGAIDQESKNDAKEGGANVKNTVTVKTTSTVDDESVLTMAGSDVEVNVGSISQKAYRGSNKVDIVADKFDEEKDSFNVALQVASAEVDGKKGAAINMLAYGANTTNTLNLNVDAANANAKIEGKVVVDGDVRVGGVIAPATEDEAAHISEDSAWGDRTAAQNTVNVAGDTVEIKGDLSLVGVKNELTLKNDSYFNPEIEPGAPKQVAENIALAGKNNKIDIAAGVSIKNIAIYDLADYDNIGKDGYELEPTQNVFQNTIILRGEADSLTFNKQLLNSLKSNDTIYVAGGKIDGDVVTSNGTDKIFLGNKTGDTTTADQVMGDSTISGNVTMGLEGAAEGTNELQMQAFAAWDRTFFKDDAGNAPKNVHGVSIGGDVEMYAGKSGNTAASNTIGMNGVSYADPITGEIRTAQATIGGSVTMNAISLKEDGDPETDSTNALTMGKLTKIGTDEKAGNVTMTAYKSNTITVQASEEVSLWTKDIDKDPVQDGENIKGYAEITGAVAMSANQNAISVGGDDNAEIVGAAAYMNGISMDQVYTVDETTKYITDVTGEVRKNEITVGLKDTLKGSELIVGTNDDAGKRADVTMGTIEYVKPVANKAAYVLQSVEIAEKGHDLYTYLNTVQATVKQMTDQNTIDVTGRFTSENVNMFAKENTISVQGNGVLGKPANADGGPVVSDEVRTAAFTANEINQTAGLKDGAKNEILATGTDSVAHWGYDKVDAEGTEEKDAREALANLQSVNFTAGNIRQDQFGWVEDGYKAVSNTVKLGTANANSVIATTGSITQLGEGDNTVEVNAFKASTNAGVIKTLADMELTEERSTVGAIAQGGIAKDKDGNDKLMLGANNTVTLTRTDVGTRAEDGEITAQTITQNAVDTNTATLTDSTSGAITQTATGSIEGKDTLQNSVKLTGSKSGAITQTAVGDNLANIDPSTVDGAITQTSTEGVNTVLAQGEYTDNKLAEDELVAKGLYNPSLVKGDIIQKSDKELSEGDVTSNKVTTNLSDITDTIDQTGFNKNYVEVTGTLAKDIEYVKDLGKDATDTTRIDTFEKAFNASVGGDILQKGGYNNEVVLKDATVEGEINQTSSDVNKITMSADTVAHAEAITGLAPADEKKDDGTAPCDYHADKNHIPETIQEAGKFNTQEVNGAITQTVDVKDAETKKALDEKGVWVAAKNTLEADNMNLKAVTQTNSDGANEIKVNVTKDDAGKYTFTGVLEKQATYVGEIDERNAPEGAVTKVGTYDDNTTTAVGAIDQKGVSNSAQMKGVVVDGAIDQTTQAAKVLKPVDAPIGNNELKIETVADVTATYVPTMTWEADKEGAEREVITWKVLGEGNKRAQNEVKGNITQTSGASGNYVAGKAAVENKAELFNTQVTGDVVQTVGDNAWVENTFTSFTDQRRYNGLVDETTGEQVEYARLEREDRGVITGKLEQTGFDNTAEVANVDINGEVKQTAKMVRATDDLHGDPDLQGEAVGDNLFQVNKGGGVELRDKAVEKLGLEERLNVADIAKGKTIVQIVDNANPSEKQLEADVTKVTADNTINAKLANLAEGGSITQTTTYGKNEINIESLQIGTADKDLQPQQLLEAGDITQTGSSNSIDAQTTDMGVVIQDAIAQAKKPDGIKNEFKLAGSKVEAVRIGDGTKESPYDVVQEQVQIADVDSITQTVTQIADADGRFNTANDSEIDNKIELTAATAGDITQRGTGMIDNKIQSTGAFIQKKKLNEADELVNDGDAQLLNKLGKVTQTGVTNDANIATAENVGNIKQTAESVKTIKTENTTVTTSMVDKINNVVVVNGVNTIAKDAETGDSITQIATSVAYDTIQTVGDAEPKVTPGVVEATNTATVTSVAHAGNVTQTIKDADGVTGGVAWGNNTITATGSNLGNVDQNAIDGNNAITLANATDEVKTVGTITQDGLQNTVTVPTDATTGNPIAANVTTKAIEQHANGIAGKEAVVGVDLKNEVTLVGKITQAKAELIDPEADEEAKKKPESWKLTQATRYETAAESIKQVADVVAEQDDQYAKLMNAANAVTLTLASVGAVEQEGDANTTNTVAFTGAEFQKEVALKLDENGKVVIDGEDKPVLEETKEIPYTIGNVTQKKGVTNTATITTAASAGDIKQTAVSNKTIDTKISDDGNTKTVTESMYADTVIAGDVKGILNEVTLNTVATAGTIEQTATSVAFDEIVTTYEKNAETGDWDSTAPTVTPKVVNAGNRALLANVNANADDAKNITQTIKDADGANGDATGNNVITAKESNLGDVKQETVNGTNTLTAITATKQTDGKPAEFVEATKTIGTIDQDGIQNTFNAGEWNNDGSLKTAGDVTTKAITQDANGVDVKDVLANAVKMEGFIFEAADVKPAKSESNDPKAYTFEPNGHAAATKAESITQNVDVKELATIEGVMYYDDAATAANTVILKTADAGAIIQTSDAKTTNTVTFEGGKYVVKTIVDFTEDPGEPGEKVPHEEPVPGASTYTPVVKDETVKANTLATVDQTGETNNATIKVAKSAGNITQTAVATKTITMPAEPPAAADLLDLDDVFGEGASALSSEDAVETFGKQYGENVGKYFFNDDVKANPFTAVETTQSKTISNTLTLEDVGTVGSIEQTALGEKFSEETKYSWWHGGLDNPNAPYPQDGSEVGGVKTPDLTKRETAYTDGKNTLTIQLSEDGKGTTVADKITQKAAGGVESFNTLTATGEIEATKDPTEDALATFYPNDRKSEAEAAFKNGSFLNSIADVEQTLKSFAEAPATEGAALPTNTITLTDIDAGTLTQTATGYAKNVITSTANTPIAQYALKEATREVDGGTVNGWEIKEAPALNPTIAAINQTGYTNKIELTNVNVTGAITVTATSIEGISEGAAVDLATLMVNDIDLTNVSAGTITAISDMTSVALKVEQAKPEDPASVTVNVYGQSDITLDNSTATGVTTGMGNDKITLTGTTKVTGTIDMGGQTATITPVEGKEDVYEIDLNGGKDVLVIASDFSGDLTGATITNVEKIETSQTVITIGSIDQTGALVLDDKLIETYQTGPGLEIVDKLIVGKLTVEGNEDAAQIQIRAAEESQGVTFTFSDGLKMANLVGSLEDDALNIGDGSILENANVGNFETVTFGTGAHAADTVTYWTDKGTDESITFNVTAADADKDGGIVVGKLGTGYTIGGQDNEVTFNVGDNDLEYVGVSGDITEWKNGEKHYTFNNATGTLAAGTIA